MNNISIMKNYFLETKSNICDVDINKEEVKERYCDKNIDSSYFTKFNVE